MTGIVHFFETSLAEGVSIPSFAPMIPSALKTFHVFPSVVGIPFNGSNLDQIKF